MFNTFCDIKSVNLYSKNSKNDVIVANSIRYNLVSFEISKSIASIGAEAFYGCDGIKNITITEKVTAIEDHLFDCCVNLKSIQFEGEINSIGNFTFRSCSSLESIEISATVTMIK